MLARALGWDGGGGEHGSDGFTAPWGVLVGVVCRTAVEWPTGVPARGPNEDVVAV